MDLKPPPNETVTDTLQEVNGQTKRGTAATQDASSAMQRNELGHAGTILQDKLLLKNQGKHSVGFHSCNIPEKVK